MSITLESSVSAVTDWPVSGDCLATADAAALESAAMAAVRNSRQLMAEAEAWLSEAFSIDPEESAALSELQILTAIHSHYSGGLAEFYRSSYMLNYTDIWQPDSCQMPYTFN